MRPATVEDFFAGNRCPVCRRAPEHRFHARPGTAPRRVIVQHRSTEKRDCLHYGGCLDLGARRDTICVPCVVCRAYEPGAPGEHTVEHLKIMGKLKEISEMKAAKKGKGKKGRGCGG